MQKPYNTGVYFLKEIKNLVVFFSSFVFFLCLLKTYVSVFYANLDLVDGRFALFMDEQGLYDGVKKILHPEDAQSFLFWVFDGNAHHYGRIFWNINAIIGFLPEYFFGPTGLIFSGRTSGVLFLSLSCFLLSVTFLKNWFFILMSFFVLINTPFSSYFMTMPKPEPLQMFFLALFLYLLKKSKFSLKTKAWFFLGLAVGTKISILPVFLPIIMFSTYQSFLSRDLNSTLKNILTTICFVMFGVSVAVPVLIKPYIVSFLSYKVVEKFFLKKRSMGAFNSLALVVSFLLVNIFYSIINKRFFGLKTGLYKWFTQTFLNTGHGFDSSEVGFFTWVKYFFTEFISPHPLLNVLLFAFAGLLVLSTIKTSKGQVSNRSSLVLEKVVFLLSGLILLFVISLTSSRIWGYYLFPGFSLFVVIMISICEMVVLYKNSIDEKVVLEKTTTKKTAFVFLFLMLVVVLGFWFPQNVHKYKELASRTKTEKYKINHRSSLQIEEALTVLSKEKKKKINVKNLGAPFVPEDGEYFSIIGLERPFIQWWVEYEVLLVKDISEVSIKNLNPNILNYDFRVAEKRGYNKWVIKPNEPCLSNVCYKKTKIFENGTELLTLVYREKTDIDKE